MTMMFNMSNKLHNITKLLYSATITPDKEKIKRNFTKYLSPSRL